MYILYYGNSLLTPYISRASTEYRKRVAIMRFDAIFDLRDDSLKTNKFQYPARRTFCARSLKIKVV